jgi:uncharacterized RDD family membrane protein YckC
MANNKKVKSCPYCGEEILAVAIKCKHCKSDLQEVAKKQNDAGIEPPSPPRKTPPPPPLNSYSTASSTPPPPPPPPISFSATPPPPVPPQSTVTRPPAATPGIGKSETDYNQVAEDLFGYPKAPLGKRVVAYLVDSAIAFLPMIILSLPFVSQLGTSITGGFYFDSPLMIPIILIGLGWSLIYYLLRDGFGSGQSWGKKMMGLMVVNLTDNSPCSKGKSAIRNVIGLLIALVLSWIPVINSLSSLVEPIVAISHGKGHRIGDMLAKTQVIDLEDYQS